MTFITNLGILLVALLHLWFLTLEMFLWQKPLGMKLFRLNPEYAKASAVLAANQGLYNGILSAGLFVSLFLNPPADFPFKLFFLAAVVVAGVYGAITVSRKIFWVQAVPALLTLLLLLFSS